MARKPKAPDKILDFKSLAEHDAACAKEGHVTILNFDGYEIRRMIHGGEPFYSVVDAVGALVETQAKDAGGYWRKLKQRLIEEGGSQVVTDCHELKLPAADGKNYRTDCANIETLLRIIQSIPSKKAEPFKQWLAKVGFERIQETAEPSRMAKRMVQAYRDLGYSDDWIDERVQQAVADGLWDGELGQRGVSATGKVQLRSAVHKEALGIELKRHREIKGAKISAELPDRMNTVELLIDRLAKTAGTEIMRARDTKEHPQTHKAAMDGAKIAGDARRGIEKQTGRSVITKTRELPKPDDQE
jgi:DNA-damage-inducible protein D